MQRDRLLLAEIVDAAKRVIDIAAGRLAEDLAADRDRRDALLWNFTVLGEAIAQLSEATRSDYGEVRWSDPVRLRNRIVHTERAHHVCAAERRMNRAGSNFGDDSTTILVPDSTSFVVIDRADERHVQRPAAGIAVFVWPLNGSPAQDDYTVRAYDPDGVVLGCVASGSRSC